MLQGGWHTDREAWLCVQQTHHTPQPSWNGVSSHLLAKSAQVSTKRLRFNFNTDNEKMITIYIKGYMIRYRFLEINYLYGQGVGFCLVVSRNVRKVELNNLKVPFFLSVRLPGHVLVCLDTDTHTTQEGRCLKLPWFTKMFVFPKRTTD